MRRNAVTLSFLLLSTSVSFAAAPPPSKQLLEKGKLVFNTNCVACHGAKGAGDGPAAVALNPKPRNYAEPFRNGDKPEDLFKTLSEGIKDTSMVSFAHLPEQERWALAYYVLELRTSGMGGGAPDAGAPPKGKAGKSKP